MSNRSRILAAVLSLGALLVLAGGCGDEPPTAPSRHAATSFKGGLPAASTFVLSPASVIAGGTSTATITLSGAAPAGGEAVTVASSNASVASAPINVTVAAGSTSGSFTVDAGVAGTATVSVTAGGVTKSAVLTVTGGGVGGGGTVTALTVAPSTVTSGTNAIGTITLDGPAPAGGTAVGVSSNNVAAATVPPNVTVAAGSTTATFTVTSHVVAAPDFAAISATAGQVTQTAVLNVNPAPGAVSLASLTLSATSVSGGNTVTGTVTLNAAAPAGGAAVALSSPDVTVATVPASVTVAAGATSATFLVTAQTVAFPISVRITGTFGGLTQGALLTVVQPAPTGRQLTSLTLASSLVVGGQSVQGTVTLASAIGGATTVTLTSTNPAVAAVPASVIVPAGVASAVFTVTTSVTNTVGFVEIDAAAGGTTSAATLTTQPAPTGPSIASVVFFPPSLGGTGPATGRVTMSGSATQGALINLTSANPGVVQVPTQIVVAANTSVAWFPVTTSHVAASTPVTVSAVACCGGLGTGSATITVTTAPPPPPDVVSIDKAVFVPGGRGGTLTVRARSTSATAILTVFRDGDTVPTFVLTNVGGGQYQGSFSCDCLPPRTAQVRSNLGGFASASVQ